MKNTKRFLAMAASLALTACAAMPMTMMSTSAEEDASSITITGDYASSHTFEIYQVMTGQYDAANGTFSELKWGADVTGYGGSAVTPGSDVTDAQITAISGITDAGTLPASLTLTGGERKYADKSGTSNVAFTGLAEGYYIVKDVTNFTNEDDSNSAWIVQVAGTATIGIKNAKPTFDKQVQDETADAEAGADAEGYGESADHAINESFNFKLKATIPDDPDLKEYPTYAIKFNDTMSNGVTYEGITSVTVKSGENSKTLAAADYTLDISSIVAAGGGSFTISIDDIKTLLPDDTEWGKDEIVVEVVYAAHLNEGAKIDTMSRTGGTTADTNYNSGFLNYSNNPDATGGGTTQPSGKTEEDYVWVFTYELDNTKYKINNSDGNELGGATFKLFDSANAEIGLIYDEGLEAYRPIKTGETAEDMVSSSDEGSLGQFNIVGLDAGSYTLRETDPPEGYNAVGDIVFEIGATHKEQTASTVDLALTGVGDGVENKIVDTKNSSLPRTGGMGTKLFVLGGGSAAALAGVYLISRKRTKKELGE